MGTVHSKLQRTKKKGRGSDELAWHRKEQEMTQIACLCVDGAAGKGNVKKSVVDAFGWRGIALETKQLKYSKSMMIRLAEYRKKLHRLVEQNGGDPSNISLLIVGKSLGAAKMYRFLYKYYDELKPFARISVVLVDPHEPFVPGDTGDTAEWYDFVYFKNGKHRLKWWDDRWGDCKAQTDPHAKLRFHVAYQRNRWPRGYAMNTPYKSYNLTGKRVRLDDSGEKKTPDHFSISSCEKTVDLLMTAIEHLQA